jgi:threonine synthase
VVPLGKIALGEALQRVLAHGAKIAHVEGNFDAALKLSRREIEGPRSKNL